MLDLEIITQLITPSQQLKKCTEIAPDYALAWGNLANMYRQKEGYENLDKSIYCFKKATKLRPHWAEGWAGLGTVFTRSSLHEEGINAYQKSIEIKELVNEIKKII